MSRLPKRSMCAGAFALLLGLAGCGDSLDVNNTSPKGSVGGIVVDATTRAPLPGVEVTVVAGGRVYGPETSADDGSFSVGGVPAGNVIVTLTGDGTYQDTWITGELTNAAGQFPTGNATFTMGPIGLIPLNNPVKFRVLDWDGSPVSDYEIAVEYIQHVDYSSGAGVGLGKAVASGTTDTSGYVTFNLPNYQLMGSGVNGTVVALLPPRDGDGDGIYEYTGGDRTFDLRNLNDPSPDIILDANYTTTLQVMTSNVRSLQSSPPPGSDSPSVLMPNGAVHVKFNLPIENDVTVTVSDEFGTPVSQTPNVSVSGDNLTINFNSNALPAGEEYNVTVHAIANVGGRTLTGDFYGPFFTPGTNPTVSAVITFHDPANENVTVEFSEPVGYPTAGTIMLSSPNCVLFFNANLGGDATIGDYANERNATSCSVALVSDEPTPTGLAKRSGYTKYWRFTAPLSAAGTPLSNTLVDFLFGRVPSESRVIEDASGQPVGDIADVIMP